MPGDIEVEVPIVLAGGQIQAHVILLAGAVDRGELTADKQVAVRGPQDCVHQAVGIVRPVLDHCVVIRPDISNIIGGITVHLGELPADKCVAAIARQLDGVDGAVDVLGPGRDRVGRGLAETEDVVPGEGLAALGDLGEAAYRVHDSVARHNLPDLLGRPGRCECRGTGGGVGGHRAALGGRHCRRQARGAGGQGAQDGDRRVAQQQAPQFLHHASIRFARPPRSSVPPDAAVQPLCVHMYPKRNILVAIFRAY